ncbi:hypothetical protein EV1_021524 [Malus domestica]
MLCMSALLWKAKVDNYRKFFDTCREIFDKLSVIFAKLSVHVTGVDAAEKDWRLFDNWDRRFDKLPVISAKLSLRVMGADVAEKDWCLFDIWDRRFDKLPVIFAKLSLRVPTRLEKQDASPISELASSIFEWPCRILSSPLRSLKSRRVLIFYRGTQFVSKHT